VSYLFGQWQSVLQIFMEMVGQSYPTSGASGILFGSILFGILFAPSQASGESFRKVCTLATSHEPRATSYELRATSYEPRATSHEPRAKPRHPRRQSGRRKMVT
jgi:hypothetical protein